MATRYLSKHHSDDDPGGLIQDALAAGPDFAGPAEDLLLAWTLRLDRAIDPRAAAARLLAAQGLDEAPTPPGEAGRLVALLRETAAAPQVQPRRRRRSRDGSTGKPPR
jgi:hypothetical protein